MTTSDGAPTSDLLGVRLRAARQASGMSLRELARRLGVSPSFVSQIENGKSQPSVATLYSLSQQLDFSIDALFHESSPASDLDAAVGDGPSRMTDVLAERGARVSRSALGSPADAFSSSGGGLARLSTSRPDERPRIVMDSAVVWEQLVSNTGDDLDFIEIIYPPQSSSTTDRRMLQHAGYEYGYLLEGELEVTVGFDSFVLHAGDAVGFDSAVPHLFRNPGAIPARGIWFVRHAH